MSCGCRPFWAQLRLFSFRRFPLPRVSVQAGLSHARHLPRGHSRRAPGSLGVLSLLIILRLPLLQTQASPGRTGALLISAARKDCFRREGQLGPPPARARTGLTGSRGSPGGDLLASLTTGRTKRMPLTENVVLELLPYLELIALLQARAVARRLFNSSEVNMLIASRLRQMVYACLEVAGMLSRSAPLGWSDETETSSQP